LLRHAKRMRVFCTSCSTARPERHSSARSTGRGHSRCDAGRCRWGQGRRPVWQPLSAALHAIGAPVHSPSRFLLLPSERLNPLRLSVTLPCYAVPLPHRCVCDRPHCCWTHYVAAVAASKPHRATACSF
jgi:hypothetical protein